MLRIRLTWGVSGQGHNSELHIFLRLLFRLPGSEPVCTIWFTTRSTSHSVAARGGCTIIPLAAGGAREDATILESGC